MIKDIIGKFTCAGAIRAELVRTEHSAFLMRATLSGAFVGCGVVLSFTAGCYGDAGSSKLVMEAVAALSLAVILFSGAEVFTGAALFMPVSILARHIRFSEALGIMARIWVANLTGAFLFACLIRLAGGGALLGDIDMPFYASVREQTGASVFELFSRGAFCICLLFLGGIMCSRTRHPVAKIALLFVSTFLFIVLGFEHSVTNMFTFSLALAGNHPPGLSVTGAFYNLVWVTIGNVAGGSMIAACFALADSSFGDRGRRDKPKQV